MVVAVARLDGRLARALRKILMEPDGNLKMDEKEWEAVRHGGVDFFKTQLAGFFHGFLPIRLEKLTLPNSESQKNKPWAAISCKVCVFFAEIGKT